MDSLDQLAEGICSIPDSIRINYDKDLTKEISKKDSVKSFVREMATEEPKNELELCQDNLETYHKALEAIKSKETCRIQTNISNREGLIELCNLIQKYPLGTDPKSMRKLAKRLKCPIKDFGQTWYNILAVNLAQGFHYCIVEDYSKKFVFALDVQKIIDEHKLTPQSLLWHSSRFDIH